jgi:hypothetical protein
VSPEQIIDAIDCGRPWDASQAMLEQLKARAFWERDIADKLRRDAADNLKCAEQHEVAAVHFDALVASLQAVDIPPPIGAAKREKEPAA